MSVYIIMGGDRNLHATVTGDFDFETSRQLLLGVKKMHANLGAEGVEVVLRGVLHTTSCAIGALILLSELAGSAFTIRTQSCSNEVHALFSSDLLERYLSRAALAGCTSCLEGEAPACAETELPDQLLAAAS